MKKEYYYYYKEDHGKVRNKENQNLTLHKDDGPAMVIPYKEAWFREGKKHREDGPAEMYYYNKKKDKMRHAFYYQQGERFSPNGGPTSIYFYENGNKEKESWVGKDDIFHRENGPAKITYHPNGAKEKEYYFQKGILHREDGPAVIIYKTNGQKEEKWFIEGRQINE